MMERTSLPRMGASEEELLSWLRSCFSSEQDPLLALHKRVNRSKTPLHSLTSDEDEDGHS